MREKAKQDADLKNLVAQGYFCRGNLNFSNKSDQIIARECVNISSQK